MKIRLLTFFVFVLCAARAQLIPGNGTGLSADGSTIALFHFDDSAATALDSSAAARNATVDGTTVTSGLFGSGRTFDGIDDRVEFGSVFNAMSGASDWTVEYFAKSNDGTNVPFFESPNPSAGIYLVPRANDILFWIKTSSSVNSWAVQGTATTPALDTAWHYYAMTWSPGVMKIYRDGVLVGTESPGGSWAGSNDYGVYMGYDPFAGGSYYGAGVVDDLRFSSVARSATEIANAYSLAAIPEPATYAALLGVGALGVALLYRRRAVA